MAALYAWYGERTRVQLDRFTVSIDKPGLPADGLTILHISDLHFRAIDRMQAAKLARLRQLLAGERYDLVALTGDLIHDGPGFAAALSYIDTPATPPGSIQRSRQSRLLRILARGGSSMPVLPALRVPSPPVTSLASVLREGARRPGKFQ